MNTILTLVIKAPRYVLGDENHSTSLNMQTTKSIQNFLCSDFLKHCDHSNFSFSEIIKCCADCSFLFIANKNIIKIKKKIDRNSICIFGFDNFEHYIIELNRFLVKYAKGTAYSKSGCQHASAFSDGVRDVAEIDGHPYCGHICDNAEHLFECSSTCHQTRGRLFPYGSPGNQWYASCAVCGATCEFTSSAALTPVLIFLRHLRLQIANGVASVGIPGSREQAVISPGTSLFFLDLFKVENYDVSFNMRSDRKFCQWRSHYLPQVFNDNPTIIEGNRYANSVVIPDDCDHQFVLYGLDEVVIPMTVGMRRLFFLLLGSYGYCESDKQFGILSIGGLKGVHVRCNEKFLEAHQRFFSGPYCQVPSNENMVEMCSNVGVEPFKCSLSEIESSDSCTDDDFDCRAQMSRAYYDEDGYWHGGDTDGEDNAEVQENKAPVTGDGSEKVYIVEETPAIEELLKDDSPLFEVEEIDDPSHVCGTMARGLFPTQGLKQRLGGLLRGISNCVTKLHAVWDYPLDKILSGIEATGQYLEDNQKYTRKDVWACLQCIELQKDVHQIADDALKGDLINRKGLEKLCSAVDGLAQKTDRNDEVFKNAIDELDKELRRYAQSLKTVGNGKDCETEALDKKMRDLEDKLNQKITLKSATIMKAIKEMIDEVDKNANASDDGRIKELEDKLQDLQNRIVKLDAVTLDNDQKKQFQKLMDYQARVVKDQMEALNVKIDKMQDVLNAQNKKISQLSARPSSKYPNFGGEISSEPVGKVGEQEEIPRGVEDNYDDFPFEFSRRKGSVVTANPQISHISPEGVPINKPQPIKQYGKMSLKKQMDPVGVVFEGDEDEARFSIQDTVVSTRGVSSEHNIIRARHLVKSFDWKVSDGEDVVIQTLPIPLSLLTTSESLLNIMSCFQYYTCSGIEFEISVTSVAMQGGTLLVAWDTMSSATRQKANSVIQLSGLSHLLIHASKSSRSTFVVSSPAIQNQCCLSGSEYSTTSLGSLKIACVNVLTAPTDSSQNVRVNIWMKFLDPVLSLYGKRLEIERQSIVGTLSAPHLGSLECIVARKHWKTTSSSDLLSLSVHPCAVKVEGGLVYQTPLSVVSSVFARWKGDLVFKIVFGNSAFVRGRLMVAAIPVQFRTENISLLDMSLFPNEIVSLDGENHSFDFVVPYHSVGRNSVVVRDALYDVSNYDSALVTTRLHIKVLDPLVMNSNASNSVSFFVTLRPGKDFELKEIVGVKAEYVNRTLAQAVFPRGLMGSSLLGSGFHDLCQNPSLMRKFKLDDKNRNAVGIAVSPAWRLGPPCITMLHWLSQLFTQWSGSLVYTLRAHSFDRTRGSFIRLWHDPNGSARRGAEIEFISDVDPPAGMRVLRWDPTFGDFQLTVPFTGRTEKLIIPKAQYGIEDGDWLQCYNGLVYVDYEGIGSINLEVSIAGGSDFEMYERGVVPKCGKVTTAFTQLSYADKLIDITDTQIHDRERLPGPTSKAVVTPVDFKPVSGVAPAARSMDKRKSVHWGSFESVDHSQAIEGDTAIDEETGDKIIFEGGEWLVMSAQAQGCMPPLLGLDFKSLKKQAQLFEKNQTCEKVVDLVGNMHSLMGSSMASNLEKSVPDFLEVMNKLSSIISSAENLTCNIEEKFSYMEGMRSKIMALLMPLMETSLPGVVKCAFEKQEYVWAASLTLLGILLLGATMTKVKSFRKKVAVLCMIIWSPFLFNKVWTLGRWISKSGGYWNLFSRNVVCRKHSLIGVSEGLGGGLSNLFLWLKENWVGYAQGIFSLFGVITSLIVWGSIPDATKLSSFASKFKSASDKGRNITGLVGGFKSIMSISKEVANHLTSWIVSFAQESSLHSDSQLQLMIDFSLAEWVKEVKELSLLENKFAGFGSLDHIVRVRRLYDKSMQIEEAIVKGCKLDVGLGLIIKDCREKCLELRNDTYSFKGMKVPRIDPIHICMIGKPGVGKSAISHLLINDLLDSQGEPQVDRIYTRCCADAYWSNYHQEPVVLYDDLGAIKSNLRLSDYAEIMGAKTNDPFSIPMAIAEEKGKHCTSKYIFSCTNVLKLDDTGDVVTKEAYYRRRNILVEVDRQPGAAMNPENPSEGLVFSVLDDEGLKERWPEGFLRDVDTTGWRFDRVPYEEFLEFCIVYTNAYMAAQKLLVASLSARKNVYRENSHGERFECESQAGSMKVSLRDIIAHFDKERVVGKDIYKGLRQQCPRALDTKNVLSFEECVGRMCECSNKVFNQVCTFWSLDLNKLRQSSSRRGIGCDGKTLGQYTMSPRVSASCFDFEFCLPPGKSIEDLFSNFDIHDILLHLINYMKWDPSLAVSQICPSSLFSAGGSKGVVCVPEDFDDMIRDGAYADLCGKRVVVWPMIAKVAPELCESLCGVCVKDKEGYVHFADNGAKMCVNEEKGFAGLKALDFCLPTDVLDHFTGSDRDVIKSLSASAPMENDPEFLNYLEKCKPIFSSESAYGVFCLRAYQQQLGRYSLARQVKERIDKREKCVAIEENYSKYEAGVLSRLSNSTKIGLAIVGGVLGVGGLVAALNLIYSGLSCLFTSKGRDGSDREPHVEIIDMPLDPQGLSGSHESGAEKTLYSKRQKVLPKRQFKVAGLSKHGLTGAHESAPEKTKFCGKQKKIIPIKRKVEPHVGAKLGFGLTYNEETRSGEQKPILVNKRQRHIRIVKQISALGNGESLESWTNNVGVLVPDGDHAFVDRVVTKELSRLSLADEDNVTGKYLSNQPRSEGRYEEAGLMELFKCNSLRKSRVASFLSEGMQLSSTKQARVGAYGLEKDLNAVSLIQTHCSKMSCVIFDATKGTQCNVLRLRDTFIVMPAHYLEFFSDDDELYFISPSKVTRVLLNRERIILVSRHQDLVVWDLGKNVPPSPNFMNHISRAADWENYSNGQGALCLTLYGGESLMQIVHFLSDVEMCATDVEIPAGYYEMFGGTHTIVNGLRYRAGCAPGFCGAAIVRSNPKMVRKIVGMHVAGSEKVGLGYAEALVFELLQAAIDALDLKNGEVLHDTKVEEFDFPVCERHCPIPNLGNLGVIGSVDKSLVAKTPAKTSIVPSPIHGMLGPVLTEPSILSTWDRRLGPLRGKWDPVFDAVTKYGSNTVPFPIESIRMVEEHLCSVFSSRENSLRSRKINDIEVGINGIDLSDYWQPINMKTSPGFPYIFSRPANGTGKKYLFEEDGAYPSGRVRYVIKDEYLKSRLSELKEQLWSGVIPSVVTLECPKDERRKLAKIYDKPATRTFTILPCEVNILFRMLFGDFAAMVMYNRHDSFCQVGIDPGTTEWSEIMNRMHTVGSKGFAGDYGKFDGIGPAPIYHSIVNVVNSWYDDGPDNARARHALLSSIIHRNGLVDEWVLKYSQGMPSGFAMTVIFNSFVNYYFMSMAWVYLVERSDLCAQANLRDFDEYTALVVYGDDNVVAVDDHFLEIYNLQTVASYLGDHGIVYTDDDKNPIHLSKPYVDISSVTFLKREFCKVGNNDFIWCAPLNKTSIVEQCNWLRSSEDPETALDQNVTNALYEASIHGEAYYNELLGKIQSAYSRALLKMPVIFYSECRARWWSNMTGAVLTHQALYGLCRKSANETLDLRHKYRDLTTGEFKPLKELLHNAKFTRMVQFEV
ncbi:TPA_asm: polyprotein [Viola inconspicua waikavirus]|uniref:Genome polyprotein n=1 Tax=Viola inconspicua waikavirus TaxID=3027355 RepID=A0AA48SFM5_9SECO|nr:TPA_asm: polyprotein [Viola inconspicua waikavirus]